MGERAKAGESPCRRYTTARGGIELRVDRERIAPRGTTFKVNLFTGASLGFPDMDRRLLRRADALDISDIFPPSNSLCLQPPDLVRLSVSYLEQRVPVLASCDSIWGACATLSLSLIYCQQHAARKLKKMENDAEAVGGNPQAPVAAAVNLGAARVLPREEQAPHDFLSQLL